MSETVRVIDNDDSFVFTLVGYLTELGAVVDVVHCAAVDPANAIGDARAVLLSPGPGSPGAAVASQTALRAAIDRGVPVLGVCLGHQVIAEAFGATVTGAPDLKHGMTSTIEHRGRGVFAGLPSPLRVGRYHSLAVAPDTLPGSIEITATTANGTIMALRHRELPISGVQFHPESVLTEYGYLLLANWLADSGFGDHRARAAALRP